VEYLLSRPASEIRLADAHPTIGRAPLPRYEASVARRHTYEGAAESLPDRMGGSPSKPALRAREDHDRRHRELAGLPRSIRALG